MSFPNPPVTSTFAQAIAGLPLLSNYRFGSSASRSIQTHDQLSAVFAPYGLAGQTPINGQWGVFQPFDDSMTYVFAAESLDLTARIASPAAMIAGGISTGQICTRDTYQPGVGSHDAFAFAVRMKFDGSPGMWPAIWLYTKDPAAPGRDASEIDVEFMMMATQGAGDWTGFNHGPGAGTDAFALDLNPWQVWHPGLDFSADFHNYQFIWTPTAIYKYVDGTLVRATNFRWTSGGPAQLLISHQIGGAGPGLQPSSPDQFPAVMSIESLKIYGV
jgi:hypothetical protein